MKSLEEYLEIANKITDLVGKHALKKFGPIKESFHKAGLEYSIAEDKECNKLYEEYLKTHTPEVALYTEEGEKNLDSDLVWTIDPIDGTTNYSVGNAFWNTQICLLKNKEPVVAVIFAPALNQKFSAIKGKEAFLNDKKIEITQVKKLDEITFGIGKGNDPSDSVWLGETTPKLVQVTRSIRIFGSAGLDLAYVASGMLDLFIESGASTWDYAPGALLIREAGGMVLNFEGKDWTIDDKTLVASNETLVKQVLKLL